MLILPNGLMPCSKISGHLLGMSISLEIAMKIFEISFDKDKSLFKHVFFKICFYTQGPDKTCYYIDFPFLYLWKLLFKLCIQYLTLGFHTNALQ